jgi:hypothetical protein
VSLSRILPVASMDHYLATLRPDVALRGFLGIRLGCVVRHRVFRTRLRHVPTLAALARNHVPTIWLSHLGASFIL